MAKQTTLSPIQADFRKARLALVVPLVSSLGALAAAGAYGLNHPASIFADGLMTGASIVNAAVIVGTLVAASAFNSIERRINRMHDVSSPRSGPV